MSKKRTHWWLVVNKHNGEDVCGNGPFRTREGARWYWRNYTWERKYREIIKVVKA